MTTTRASATATKGKGRAVSPRNFAQRTTAARVSAGRATAQERVVAARAPSAQDPAPFEELTASQSSNSVIPNGTQLETVVLAALSVDGAPPTITRRRTIVANVAEVLHGAEAEAALAAICAANSIRVEDPNAMVISPPTSPLPPASITDVEGVGRFFRHQAAQQFVQATKDTMQTKAAIEAADEDYAAELQAEEIVAAWGYSASTSGAASTTTPGPATPMEVTPAPAPVRRHATPVTPCPMSHTSTAPLATRMPPHGPYDAQGRLPPNYIGQNRSGASLPTVNNARMAPAAGLTCQGTPSNTAPASISRQNDAPASVSRQNIPAASVPCPNATPASVPHQNATSASVPRQNAIPGRARQSAAAGRARQNAAAGPSRSRQNATAVSSGPPAYALNEASVSFFTVPMRPTPLNGFVKHEVIATSTEMVDGTPYITILDFDAGVNADANAQDTDEEYAEN